VSNLNTLPQKEIRGGLAEVIKYGVIKDKKFFEFLEQNVERVFSFDADVLIRVIKRSCEIKGEVVELDEKESNLRKILNFGHTIGHAIENFFNYTISHGEAISMGMVAEGRTAVELGLWQENELNRLISLLRRAGLPVNLPDTLDLKQIIDTMKLDKKARSGRIEMTLPRQIGEMAEVSGSYGIRVTENMISSALLN
jgi:3-dehydroquinate synthase